MQVITPQISWHSQEPIFSIDFHPIDESNGQEFRLATAGADAVVRVSVYCREQIQLNR
jgi:hypothetical protein